MNRFERKRARRRARLKERRVQNRTTIAELDDEIERAVFSGSAPPPSTLWHFTNWAGFEGILKTGCVWATHYTCTNDRSEIMHAHDVIVRAVQELHRQGPRNEFALFLHNYEQFSLTALADIYLASFCEREHDAGQWRSYGNGGAGVALGFDLSEICHTAPLTRAVGMSLVPIQYDAAAKNAAVRKDAEAILHLADACAVAHPTLARRTEYCTVKWLFRAAGAFSTYLKDDGWQAEREWRLTYTVMKGPDAETLPVKTRKTAYAETTPYVEYPLSKMGERLPLREVVLGPKSTRTTSDVERVLSVADLDGAPTIRRSALQLR